MDTGERTDLDCPQCGSALVTYALDEAVAPVCERCEWVGIDADHHPEVAEVESWEEALRRFYRSHTDPRPVEDREGTADRDPDE